MKNYEEMTDSVLDKVRLRREQQRRKHRNIVFVTLGVAGIMLTVWMLRKPHTSSLPDIQLHNPTTSENSGLPTGTIGSTPEAPRLTLLCAAPGEEPARVMEEHVEVPYKAQIRVRDINGLTEEQLLDAVLEERAYAEQMKGIYPEDVHYGRHRREHVLVSTISVGSFSVKFEDIQSVARIRATVTSNGYLVAYPRTESGCYYAHGTFLAMDIDGDSFRQSLTRKENFDMEQNDHLELFWQISSLVADKINANPDMNLSQISDYITLTVNYTDGREETTRIFVKVSDDGQVSAIREETLIQERPGATRWIVSIRDLAAEENIPCDSAEEKFYEDEHAAYYFNVTKSQHIMVFYNNSNTENIVDALTSGRATVADLEQFGIAYYTKPKNKL